MSDWTAKDVAERLSGVGEKKSRKMGTTWMACCPAHADRTPSLSLKDGHKGLLWYCMAGCDGKDVLEALKDVMGGVQVKRDRPVRRPKIIERTYAPHIPTAEEAHAINIDDMYHFRLGMPSQAWAFNRGGHPIMFVARYETETGKELVPWTWQSVDGREPEFMMKAWEKDRPLYNLDELLARPDAPVLYVEGEKTADAAKKLFPNFVVTTHHGGGKTYSRTDMSPLEGRMVIIQPDADQPGMIMAEGLWMHLKGIARSCKMFHWPTSWPDGSSYEVKEGFDCADHKDAGWTHAKIVEMREAGKIKLVEPDPVVQFGDGNGDDPSWARVMMRRDDTCAITVNGRIIASCRGDLWRKVVDLVEDDINQRMLDYSSKHEPGRFPRWRGQTSVYPQYNGEVYMMIEMLSREVDIDTCKQSWSGMHPHMRRYAYKALIKKIEKEDDR